MSLTATPRTAETPQGPATVRFGRRSTRGVLLGLSAPRLVAVGAALLVLVPAVYAAGPAGVIATAPLWGVGLARRVRHGRRAPGRGVGAGLRALGRPPSPQPGRLPRPTPASPPRGDPRPARRRRLFAHPPRRADRSSDDPRPLRPDPHRRGQGPPPLLRPAVPGRPRPPGRRLGPGPRLHLRVRAHREGAGPRTHPPGLRAGCPGPLRRPRPARRDVGRPPVRRAPGQGRPGHGTARDHHQHQPRPGQDPPRRQGRRRRHDRRGRPPAPRADVRGRGAAGGGDQRRGVGRPGRPGRDAPPGLRPRRRDHPSSAPVPRA